MGTVSSSDSPPSPAVRARAAAWPWWSALAAAAVGLALLTSPGLGWVDDVLGDVAARFPPAVPGGAPTPLIVGIGDRTLTELGPWPLARRHHAALLRRLHAWGARVVAFDILFDRPSADPADDLALAGALRETGIAVLAVVLQPVRRMDSDMRLRTEVEVRAPGGVLAGAGARTGFVNVTGPGEESGLIRHCRVAADAGGRILESLALSTARGADFAGEPPEGLRRIRWLGSSASGAFRLIEMADLIGGRADPGDLAATPVMVGATARALGDVKETPIGDIPGVEVNANVVCDLLWAGFVRSPPAAIASALVAGAGLLAAGVLALAPAWARLLGACYLAALAALGLAAASRGFVAGQPALLAALPLACLLPRRRTVAPSEAARAVELLASGEPEAAQRLLERVDVQTLDLETAYRLAAGFDTAGRPERARELFGSIQRRDLAFRDAGARFLELDGRLVAQTTVLGPEGVRQALEAVFAQVERVGAGGSGLLYRCHEIEGGESIAVKVLDPRLLASGESLARFRRETEILGTLSHPGIARFLGAVFGKLCYYRMEFVAGEPLSRRLAGGWRPGESEAADLLRQAASALSHAHGAGVLHRDLKPSNLMLAAGGRLVVVDFGVARLEGAERLTREGTFVGTMAYAAPEQLRGEAVDERADVYGLGAVWRELAGPELAGWTLAPLVARMCAGDPAGRPRDMAAVLAELPARS